MITRHIHKGISWIDLESPTQDELRVIADEFQLNPLVVHELGSPTLKPKVDLYDKYAYLILHFPHMLTRDGKRSSNDLEIDFIIGKKFMISTHYGASEPMRLFGKLFDTNAIIDKTHASQHAGFILFRLLSSLYDSLDKELLALQSSLESIEEMIFQGEENKMVFAISRASRNLLDFSRSISLHRAVLESFETAGRTLFGKNFEFHLRTLVSACVRVEHTIASNTRFLAELRETNNSLLGTKQNEIMKTFTILAFIALPATTILSLFQIDSVARPIVGTRFDFWILVLLLVAIAFSLYSWFKFKRWL